MLKSLWCFFVGYPCHWETQRTDTHVREGCGGLDYSEAIQHSIDSTFITTQQALASANMMPAVPFMQAQADINVRNAEADALKKWNGAIPAMPASVTTVGQGWIDGLLGYLGFGAKTPEKR